MRQELKIEVTQPIIGLADRIVYSQSPCWCNSTFCQLSLSLLRPRQYYSYDRTYICPLIIFICGGAFEQMDRNVWMGELAYFAKKGYAVACVEYSTLPRTRWPQQLMDIKQAIRFLRSHAAEYGIQANRIAVMGESAGGYLAALTGLTGDNPLYKTDADQMQSDAVQAVIAWYPVTDLPGLIQATKEPKVMSHLTAQAPSLLDMVTPGSPPFFLVHGTDDEQVPYQHSELLYNRLQKSGVSADLYLLRGAHHNDAPFVQNEMKERMGGFLDHIFDR